MLSHAWIGRNQVISCQLRYIGGYRSTVDYICYRATEPWGEINRGRTESLCRLTHVIPSVPVKDHTIVGTSDKIERMPIT